MWILEKRCEVLYDPEVQKKYLIKEIKIIKIETRSRVIKNYNNHENTRPIGEVIGTIKNVIRWVKSARVFRNNTRKSRQQDIINFLLMS